jgi:hypothetical protein
VLAIAERELPADLLAAFALGRYVVREGKLAKMQVRPVAAASLAKLLGIEAEPLDLSLFAAGAAPSAGTSGPTPAKAPESGVARRKRARAPSRKAKTARPSTAATAVGGRLRGKRGKG